MIVHEETPQVAGEVQLAPTCCHYWIIETAQGPISRGDCQICHEVRDFKNSVFDMDRDSQDSRSRKGLGAEEKNQPAVAPQLTGEIDPEPDHDELDTEAPGTEEAKTPGPDTEAEIEEPEFAGVLED